MVSRVDTRNNEILVTINRGAVQAFSWTDDGYATPKRTMEGGATGLDELTFVEIDGE